MTVNHKALPWAAIAVVMLLDQLSKWWVVEVLGLMHRPPLVVNEYFALVMVWNRGVSFGMLNHQQALMPFVLVAVAIAISALLLRYALKATHRGERLAYGMVIGGALSNALDRMRVRAVADFLYVHYQQWGWPAFNVADAMICCGVGLLLWIQFRSTGRS